METSGKNWSKVLLQVSAAAFLLAAAGLSIWWVFQPKWFNNIKAEVTNQPYARTVTVSAEGKITAKPDIAVVSLSVVSQGMTVKAVTQDGNRKMDAVIAAVKQLGVESKDVTSSQYNLYPEYKYLKEQSPKISGYKLDQEITVKVRKLETVEDVLDAGIGAGANQVGQLNFEIDDASAIKKEARTIAFKKAREKAEEMAAAAGVTLGRVITFSEDAGYMPQPIYANYAMDMVRTESAIAAPSIEPGSKEISNTVSVTYEIQ